MLVAVGGTRGPTSPWAVLLVRARAGLKPTTYKGWCRGGRRHSVCLPEGLPNYGGWQPSQLPRRGARCRGGFPPPVSEHDGGARNTNTTTATGTLRPGRSAEFRVCGVAMLGQRGVRNPPSLPRMPTRAGRPAPLMTLHDQAADACRKPHGDHAYHLCDEKGGSTAVEQPDAVGGSQQHRPQGAAHAVDGNGAHRIVDPYAVTHGAPKRPSRHTGESRRRGSRPRVHEGARGGDAPS